MLHCLVLALLACFCAAWPLAAQPSAQESLLTMQQRLCQDVAAFVPGFVQTRYEGTPLMVVLQALREGLKAGADRFAQFSEAMVLETARLVYANPQWPAQHLQQAVESSCLISLSQWR